jgi:hypothetical protein
LAFLLPLHGHEREAKAAQDLHEDADADELVANRDGVTQRMGQASETSTALTTCFGVSHRSAALL